MWEEIKEFLRFVFTNKNDSIAVNQVVTTPQFTPAILPIQPMPQKILATAKEFLGQHLTLNPSVPPEVGCAEAVSTLLQRAGISGIPATGFASTLMLYQWLAKNPQFEAIHAPEAAAVLVSPTGMGNGEVRGHTGIVGAFGVQYANDYGICSNDSNSGLFLELWSVQKWQQYYAGYGALPMYYFRAL